VRIAKNQVLSIENSGWPQAADGDLRHQGAIDAAGGYQRVNHMTFDPYDRVQKLATREAGDGLRTRPAMPCPIVPRGVKKAIDFIEANLGSPITVADLIAVSELSGRTLFKHFSDFVGTSPMAYLRARRLERVREELVSGKADSVTKAALRWGFTHLGRFAAEYCRMCGELPSATLRRAR
jgi:AraC-like DNA-binding protein